MKVRRRRHGPVGRRLPYSNGAVGMWGRSYFAETQWRAASRKPPACAASPRASPPAANAINGGLVPRRRGGTRQPARWGHSSIAANEIAATSPTILTSRNKEWQSWPDLDRAIVRGHALRHPPRPRPGRAARRFFARRSSFPRPGIPMNTFTRDCGTARAPGRSTSPHCTSAAGSTSSDPSTLDQYLAATGAQPDRCGPRAVADRGPVESHQLLRAYRGGALRLNPAPGVMNDLGDLSGLHDPLVRGRAQGRPRANPPCPGVRIYVMGENRWRGFDELPGPREPELPVPRLPRNPRWMKQAGTGGPVDIRLRSPGSGADRRWGDDDARERSAPGAWTSSPRSNPATTSSSSPVSHSPSR